MILLSHGHVTHIQLAFRRHAHQLMILTVLLPTALGEAARKPPEDSFRGRMHLLQVTFSIGPDLVWLPSPVSHVSLVPFIIPRLLGILFPLCYICILLESRMTTRRWCVPAPICSGTPVTGSIAEISPIRHQKFLKLCIARLSDLWFY